MPPFEIDIALLITNDGPPHVDEDVSFLFNPAIDVNGRSIEVLLSEYESMDIIDLHVELASGPDIDLSFLETTDTVHKPYQPFSFTLYPDLRIHTAYNGYWFLGRPTMEDLRRDLREIAREIRSDWSL